MLRLLFSLPFPFHAKFPNKKVTNLILIPKRLGWLGVDSGLAFLFLDKNQVFVELKWGQVIFRINI